MPINLSHNMCSNIAPLKLLSHFPETNQLETETVYNLPDLDHFHGLLWKLHQPESLSLQIQVTIHHPAAHISFDGIPSVKARLGSPHITNPILGTIEAYHSVTGISVKLNTFILGA